MNSRGFNTLLTDGDSNPKTAKSNKVGEYLTTIMHFAHASTSGYGNVCASASPGCIATCLDYSGHGAMQTVQKVRAARTKFWLQNREEFKVLLVGEIQRFLRKCNKLVKKPAIRLNGTSDIVWERAFPELFTMFPQVQFYDYTKHVKRVLKSWELPTNYHLTFSRSEINDDDCRRVLKSGKCNVAVVFADQSFPNTWEGHPVYVMDNDDLRFLDPPGGQVGGLYAKGGKAKRDDSGFIIPTSTSVVGV